MEYAINRLRKGEVKYSSDDSNLKVYYEKNKQEIVVPLSDIKKVWIDFSQDAYYISLYTAEKKFIITSKTMNKFGRYEKKYDEYTSFVKELHSKLAAVNSNAKFVCGSSLGFIFGWILLALGIFVLFLRWVVGLRVPIVLGLPAAPAIPAILAGRKKTYEPDKIPTKFLPA